MRGYSKRSRYSDWLRAGRPSGWSSSPAKDKIFLFSVSSRPVLGLTQHLIQWAPESLAPGVKRTGRETDHSLPTIAGGQECVHLHIHSPIRLHGLVLN
jgi:hypothetical protein